MANHGTFRCTICGSERSAHSAVHGEMIHGATAELIRQRHPGWEPAQLVCRDCLNQFRAAYVTSVLEEERGELTSLDAEVVESLRQHELLSRNINTRVADTSTLGQRVADRIASFGGSWPFLFIFGGVLFTWIAINSIGLLGRPFDPYPFILLNLGLSCLAAVQAPVIMMSQNRQESRDRLRAEEDYRVNLKAELEIRHLQSKLDQLLSRQWSRLIEIQRIQVELLEELGRKR
ncbi:MAG: DUF1003 domain-containing protein [Candidatus Eisenbacteria bacterium]